MTEPVAKRGSMDAGRRRESVGEQHDMEPSREALSHQYRDGAGRPRCPRRTFLLSAACASTSLAAVGACSIPQSTVLKVVSTADRNVQRCTWLAGAKSGATLVVSLPTWSGSYAQPDPLLEQCRRHGWAYLRPNVRAPNNSSRACLGPLVLKDLDDALDHVGREFGASSQRVLVGESGGGYTALGAWLRGRTRFDRVIVWNPIADLEPWFAHTRQRYPKIAADLIACTSGGAAVASNEARRRSPLHWIESSATGPRAPLEIYAGLHDGHQGSVPLSQSLAFFNAIGRLHEQRGHCEIGPALLARLVRADRSLSVAGAAVAGRAVHYIAVCSEALLTVFDGAHEHLTGHTALRIAATDPS